MAWRNAWRNAWIPLVIYGFTLLSLKSPTARGLDVVKVDGGLVSGTRGRDRAIHIFRGVPFAAPPVGALRWKAPQPVIPWKGVRRCDTFGPSPMQGDPVPFGPWSREYLIPPKPISEDCLYLNIWTGASSGHERRPVLVWIYGGGFLSGGSAVPVYDGEAMARKGIVFVSINYRVGIFGFFAHPWLTRESGRNASGNYGLMDQVAALRWVQKNIAAFGGDPAQVTIAGQSAGSMSVNCLVASPLCHHLFTRAIAESGASVLASGPMSQANLSRAESEGTRVAELLHASSIEQLRGVPAADLLKVDAALRGPIVDGYVLPASVPEIFRDHRENDVDLLTGWNQDDGVVFGKPLAADAFKKELSGEFGDVVATGLLRYYPAGSDTQAAASQASLSRDRIFGVQNYTWANLQATEGRGKVYVYRFTRPLPATGEYRKYGAFHTGEVAYAYDNLDSVHRCPWEQGDRVLAGVMSSYWANFIKYGNPNGRDLPFWPAYDTTKDAIMILDVDPHAAPLPGKESLDFLAEHLR